MGTEHDCLSDVFGRLYAGVDCILYRSRQMHCGTLCKEYGDDDEQPASVLVGERYLEQIPGKAIFEQKHIVL